jgi:pyruvate dehydrogenase E2 component (dihydrolipoamide acetyltransferase)
MSTKIVLPELGKDITKAVVSFWYFKVGDKVNEKEDLVEVTTDKATFNVPSLATGTISQIYAHEGDTVKVGEPLALIE